MNVEKFAQRMKATRKQRRMSLGDVAKGAGISKPHVWALERGSTRNPSVRAVWGIAEALDVSPGWLMGIYPAGNQLEPLAFRVAAIIRDEVLARTPNEIGDPS